MRIAVDGWGGDFAPEEIIKGVREAYSPDYTLVVVGPRPELLSLYSQMGMGEECFPIENASQVVGMGESPTEALKKKPDSTIAKGIDLLAQGKIDAFISAGNSGAVMAAAWVKLKRISQIERPAITTLIPNSNSCTVLLDVGANVDCKPKHLLHFAVMGAEYAKIVLNLPHPRVGLLNVGEEEGKGNELVKSTYQLFRSQSDFLHFDFAGNVEGHNIVDGKVDVVVCDGFSGNALLKFGEGLIAFISSHLPQKMGNPQEEEKLKEFWRKLDRSEYGGAPLLGVEGVCLVCHGSSRAKDIKSAIKGAKELIEKGIVNKIRERLSQLNLKS